MWHTVVRLLLARPLLSLLTIFFFALLSATYIPSLEIAEDTDFFTLEDNAEILFYEAFKEEFGNDEFFLVTLHTEDIFTTANLQILKELSAAIEDIPYIREVTSLTTVEDIVGTEDSFFVEPLIPEIPQTTEELNALRQQTMQNKMFVRSLISEDGTVAAVVVLPRVRGSPKGFRGKIFQELEKIVTPLEQQGFEIHSSGWTLTNYYLNQYSIRDLAVFIPLTILLMLCIVAFFFRSASLTGITFCHILITFVCCAALMHWCGIVLNNVTGIVFPVLLCLSLTDCVHIFSAYARVSDGAIRDRVETVFADVLYPCFFTSLTTGIGFASLMFSDVPPIFEFGMVSSIAVMLEFFIVLLLMPPLMLFFNPTARVSLTISNHFYARLNAVTHRYRKPIVLGSTILLIMSVYFMQNLRVDTNLIDYFKASSSIRTSLDTIEKHLAGAAAVDVSLTAPTRDAFKMPANLRQLENLQQAVDTLAGVDHSISLADFVKDMHASFNDEDQSLKRIPQSQQLIEQYLLLYDADDIEDVINFDFNHARIAVRSSEHSTAELKKLIQKMEALCAEHIQPPLHCRITGQEKELVLVADALVKGQIESICYAYLIVLGVMVLALRSFSFGIFSLLPNILPVVGNFAIMGFFDIPINTGTALISSVAFGIAVDDSIHFLVHYVKLRRNGELIPAAVQDTLQSKGTGIITSSIILALGFAVLAFGNFVPVIQFGLLTAVVMLTALAADIILLPALFYFYHERFR